MAIAVLLVAASLASSARAQQISVTAAPSLGTIISASGATTFTFAASNGNVSQQGGAIRRTSGGTRALITVTCNVTWCGKNAAKITVQHNGTNTGRAGNMGSFTIQAGSGMTITSAPSGTDPVTFNIAAIGSGKSVTFYVGGSVTLAGDSSSQPSGSSASGFRITVEDVTKASNSAQKDGATAAMVYHAINISAGTPLKFGRIVLPSGSAGKVDGSVTMQPADPGAIPTKGVQLDPGKTSNGSFTITGESGTFYNLTVPQSITLSNGSNSIPLSISTTASGARQFAGTSPGAAAAFTFTIGGSFGFSSDTPGGAYTGSVPVIVQYQ
jgi:hypothetical protein